MKKVIRRMSVPMEGIDVETGKPIKFTLIWNEMHYC